MRRIRVSCLVAGPFGALLGACSLVLEPIAIIPRPDAALLDTRIEVDAGIDAARDNVRSDVRDEPRPADAGDAPDVLDSADAFDATADHPTDAQSDGSRVDASDASDALDRINVADVLDAPDARDVTIATDAGVSDGGPHPTGSSSPTSRPCAPASPTWTAFPTSAVARAA
ncbi:MAG: hypothetical protein WCJ30_12305 [Deltaproteobacteria bacterium]